MGEKRMLQLEDMRRIEYLSGLALSPDGRQGLYVVRVADGKGEFIPHIFRIDLDSGREWRLVADSAGSREGFEMPLGCAGYEDAPAWSPDGRRIAFLRTEGGDAQLWLTEAGDGSMRKATGLRHGVEEFCWSPDGRQIAFTSRIFPGEEAAGEVFGELSTAEKREWEEQRAREPIAIENLMYKMDEWHGIQDGSTRQVGILDVESGKAWMVTGGDVCHYSPSWSPDGTRLACYGKPHRHTKEQRTELFVLDLASGEVLLQDTGEFGVIDGAAALFAPDGRGLVYLAYQKEACGAYMEKLFYKEIGQEGRCLFPEEESCHGVDGLPIGRNALGRQNPVFQLDGEGQFVYFLSGWMGENHIFRLPLTGKPFIEQVTRGKIDVHSFTAPRGGRILFTRGDLLTIAELYCLEMGGARAWGSYVERRLAEHNQWLSEIRLSEPQELWVRSKDGKARIHGFVLEPVVAVDGVLEAAVRECPAGEPGALGISGGKFPAVLDIHGGPTAFYSYDFWFEFQMLAASGMAVIYCDPRGSSGYGAEFSRDDYAWGQEAVEDLRSFMDAAIGLGFIDRERVGVTGGSYGGHMTNRLIGTTDWFAAAVSQRNLCNLATSYGTGDMGFIYREEGMMTQMENFMSRVGRSPITRIDQMKTPLLILHATRDYRCGYEQAEQLFIAMKDRNPEVPVRLVAFPGENHGMTRDGKLHFQMAHLAEMVRWFGIYLAGKSEAEREGCL